MTFLCPSRSGRNKEKKFKAPFLGRITGSCSIDTLVRVGLEKQHGLRPDSKMIVTQDFLPCADNELEIRRGEEAYVLYKENEWAYVLSDQNKEGFVPNSFLVPYKLFKRRSVLSNVENDFTMWEIEDSEVDTSHDENNTADIDFTTGDFTEFMKKNNGDKYAVLFPFVATNENDISVERGDVITSLNEEDKAWLWVIKTNNEEGFIPTSFCCRLKPKYVTDEVDGAPPLPPRDYLKVFNGKAFSSSSIGEDILTTKGRRSESRNTIVTDVKSVNHKIPPFPIPNANTTKTLPIPTEQRITQSRFRGTSTLSTQPKPRSPTFIKMVVSGEYTCCSKPQVTVQRGEVVFVDFDNQKTVGWLWVYSPAANKYFNIPSTMVKQPNELNQQSTKIALV